MNDEYERIKKKIDYFSRNSIPVHISKLKGWSNGFITKVTPDYITLDEYEDGLQDIFIVDIKDIDKFTPKILRDMDD